MAQSIPTQPIVFVFISTHTHAHVLFVRSNHVLLIAKSIIDGTTPIALFHSEISTQIILNDANVHISLQPITYRSLFCQMTGVTFIFIPFLFLILNSITISICRDFVSNVPFPIDHRILILRIIDNGLQQILSVAIIKILSSELRAICSNVLAQQ